MHLLSREDDGDDDEHNDDDDDDDRALRARPTFPRAAHSEVLGRTGYVAASSKRLSSPASRT